MAILVGVVVAAGAEEYARELFLYLKVPYIILMRVRLDIGQLVMHLVYYRDSVVYLREAGRMAVLMDLLVAEDKAPGVKIRPVGYTKINLVQERPMVQVWAMTGEIV
jgi:hypothetical protein